MDDKLEAVIRWVAAFSGVAVISIALFGVWYQQTKPSGRAHGKNVKLLTNRLYVIVVTIIYVTVMYLLWKPIPVMLPGGARLILDVLGAVIFFPSIALYLLGMRTLGTMFGVSSSFGVRLYTGHRLITGGPYRFIRHPMYLAVICAGIGGLLIFRTWAMLLFSISMFGLIFRARREEKLLALEFGLEWEEYKRRVPGWIPGVRPETKT